MDFDRRLPTDPLFFAWEASETRRMGGGVGRFFCLRTCFVESFCLT